MKFKDKSIDPKSLQPQLLLALMVAQKVYDEHGTDLIITSLNDGKHSKRSLHYAGAAVDLRTFTLPSEEIKQTVKDKIQARLNQDYDVVLESTHIHIEYQPEYRGD